MNDLPRTQALRCFITVAREGTVSRAANLLNLTQPAVSLQLKGLEESTGLLLFNRTPGGFTLTEAGAALLPLAHKAVSASSDFRTMADSLKESLRGSLRVGTILDPEFIRLGPFVRSLATSLKKTEVFLRYGMSDDVLAQIGKGDLDVGYYVDATPPESLASGTLPERHIEDGKYQLAPLMSYDYRVIAPAEWSDKVLGKDWPDLIGLPWLATPPHSAHRRLLDDIFRPMGSLPKRVAFTDPRIANIGVYHVYGLKEVNAKDFGEPFIREFAGLKPKLLGFNESGEVARGEVHPDRMLTNAGACVGDLLVLTKPLGTGILATALKRDALLETGMADAVRSMTTLNDGAARAALKVGMQMETSGVVESSGRCREAAVI
jgi:DNA-binding transcriptional LysR family regulator